LRRARGRGTGNGYALESQVAKLRALTIRLDIQQIELAGNSMGGTPQKSLRSTRIF